MVGGKVVIKKKIIWKDIFTSIKDSKGRFFSIFGLMLLGAFVLVGLNVTGSDMRKTGQRYFEKYNAADITLISNKGLDKNDVKVLKKAKGIKDIEYGYLKDVTFKGSKVSIRLFSKGKKISLYVVKEGRLPKIENEIALDYKYKDKYKINSKVSFTEKKDIAGHYALKHHTFKVVGFIRSSEIISDVNQGASKAGSGSLNGYALVDKSAFKSDIYMLSRMTFKDLYKVNPYSKAYVKRLASHKESIQTLLKNQPKIRLSDIKDSAYKKIDYYQEKLNEKRNEFEDKRNALNSAKSKLLEGKNKLSKGENDYKTKIRFAQDELSLNEEKINSGYKELSEKESELEIAKQKLSEEKALLRSKENEKKLQEKEKFIQSKEVELQENKKKLESESAALEEKRQEFITKQKEGEDELKRKSTELKNKEKEYKEKEQLFLDKKVKIENKLNDKQKSIDEVKTKVDHIRLPKYNLYNRKEIPGGEGYRIYQTVSNVIDDLAKVFPVFLYFVAALVTLTTMTRFVEEERIKFGTLKALGYDDEDVLKKVVVYGLLSSISGTILGIILGHTLLPYIVYFAYKNGFTMPMIELHFDWKISLIAIAFALISAVLSAYLVGIEELRESPARLLLPKAPKEGTKILLEYIPFIWNRLSFTHKVTARNLFRYKKRMFMTIFGVAGSIAMLYTGYSVQASIRDINNRQFLQILHYDLIVVEDDYVSTKDYQNLKKVLNKNEVKKYNHVHFENLYNEDYKTKDKQEIKLLVSSNNSISSYVNLQNRKTKEKLKLNDDGIIISERLSKVTHKKVGDMIRLKDSNNREKEFKITGITEMYMGHFAFITGKGYTKIFGKIPYNNAYLVNLKDRSVKNTEKVASEFMNSKGVYGVVQNTMLINQVDTIVKALNKIMTILIIIASMLGTVILYNLTNINVSERIRELSTIKVLGFYDKEVTEYIYRETSILTLIGILVGFLIGEILHQYILDVVPPSDVMFDPAMRSISFIIPAFIILIVTMVLALIIHNKLKNVDMLSALKSVE